GLCLHACAVLCARATHTPDVSPLSLHDALPISRPQLMRTRSGLTPAAASCSSFIWRWVVLAGCRQQVRASATWVSIAAIFKLPINALAASRPPLTPKLTTPQLPLGRYFWAAAW